MKTIVICISMLLLTGCGKWFAEWQGEVKKIRLTKDGEAELLKAENEKKIQVEDAKAKLETAKLFALSEIERAKGVAEANKIIGNSLKGNESYLRYLWIQTLNNDSNDVIYIPTEANLPVLESTKRIKTNLRKK